MISKSSVPLNLPPTAIYYNLSTDSVQGLCTVSFMKLNTGKTSIISPLRKTSALIFNYKLCQFSITRAGSTEELAALIDFKLLFHNHVDYIFFQCVKLLGLARNLNFSISSLDCLYMSYFTLYQSLNTTLLSGTLLRALM
jgi:hypothetical protein